MTPLEKRFKAKLKPMPSGCIEWTGAKVSKGYGSMKAGPTTIGTHRYAWELANGKIPKGLFVLHKCDNRACCNPEHLWIGTNADNVADMDQKGRRADTRGMNHPQRKLNEDQVISIRSDERSNPQIASEYGVTKELISQIKRRVCWKHLAEAI